MRTTDRCAARATAAGLYALTEDAFAAMTEKPAQDPAAAAEKLKATLDEYVKLRRENATATIALAGQYREARANADAMKELALAAISGGARVEHPSHHEQPPPQPMPPSPLFSTAYEDFLAARSRPSDEHRGYDEHTIGQLRATYRLWQELVGDLPVREYTREQAAEFRKLLLRLPATFGKVGRGKRKSARDEIKRIEGTDAETMQMKTVKRHFSALNQLFGWLKDRGHVAEVISTGFPFPLPKGSRSARDEWSAEDLHKVFHSSRYASDADRTTAEWWLPLIALHTGMRLEEICRLRPGPTQDIQVLHGVACIVIQRHPDGWDPKTEAGARIIPIHPTLVELGLLELVERRRREGAPRLFPELRMYRNKLGHEYSRDFSSFKIALGVNEKTVFHSFRHNVRTMIDAEDVQERWLDALMGHEGPNAGVGRRVYNKRTDIQRLRQLVEAIRPEVDLSHLRRSA